MDSASLSSATYLTGVGLFIVVGLAAMFGLPHFIFSEAQGRIRTHAIPALVVMLVLTVLGAVGVVIGQ